MTLTLSWVDNSEKEMQRALEVIQVFKQKDTRDELGIGPVRDSLSELMFPGTSTIQTRARYFLFIPWIYRDLENRLISGPSINRTVSQEARRREVALIDGLSKSPDQEGLIGIDARANLKRLPSIVYWAGLLRWDTRRFRGSQAQYHRFLTDLPRLDSNAYSNLRNDEGELVEEANHASWDPHLPAKPRGFPSRASFELTREEAHYLRNRVMQVGSGTVLDYLMQRGQSLPNTQFPWQQPQCRELPPACAQHMEQAQHFSETVHGAFLVYNLMLAEQSDSDKLRTEYQDRLHSWATSIWERRYAFQDWNLERFWGIASSGSEPIPSRTRHFVNSWLNLVLNNLTSSADLYDAATGSDAKTLVYAREKSLKRRQARLDNQQARALWNGNAGTAQLNYRWPVVQRLISDIQKGLTGN